ncbi:TPR domain-containing protein, putative [Eimeria maxima]|uniref:RING-type E3 ubiquitin transferase n=1 Tax=Eimeria maxima TaxID=5804 RepID=U6M9B4_EIMMA|nr:TPR domain-containing protein, putative [Eimeria maxima]CDJ60817.1 TPR domain-containing protein, putative [Eimeria maxima]
MESFFQAALNSVLEAAVGSSRSGRTSTADGSTNNIGATRTNSSTGTTGGIASRSGGNVHRSSRPTETSGATSARSGNPNAVQGTRCEPANRDQAQNTSFDQPGQPNKNGSSNNFTGGKRSGNSSSSSKGVSNPDSQNPRGNSQVRDRQAADRLKDLGNESFRRGMYGLAAEYYSKAIEVDATVASYFTNRALCHKREKRYPEALEDAEAALALDETNVKGLYIKGDALVQLGDYDAGVTLLEKAQKASSSEAGRAANEIRHSLLNAKKLRSARWRRQRLVDRKDLEAFLRECIEVAAQQRRLPREEVDGRLAQLELLVAEAAEADAPFEVPDFLTCKISMVLLTPSSRDECNLRPSIIDFPTTFWQLAVANARLQEPCDAKRLVPNYAVKEATSWFLERQVWQLS